MQGTKSTSSRLKMRDIENAEMTFQSKNRHNSSNKTRPVVAILCIAVYKKSNGCVDKLQETGQGPWEKGLLARKIGQQWHVN